MYGELGRYPLFITRYVRIVKYWARIVNSENILIVHLYNSLVDACNKGVNNWAKGVRSLLDTYGFSYVWNNPNSVNLKTFYLVFKQRVVDVFKQNWFNDIARNGTLVLYKEFKQCFEYENYLTELPSKLRIPLAKLRLSSHQLLIETGRYSQNRTERAQRLCTLCDRSDVEDEYHFVIICPLYSHLRVSYIRPYYYKKHSVYKFIQLMQSDNLIILRNLGKFLQEAFSLRKSHITT